MSFVAEIGLHTAFDVAKLKRVPIVTKGAEGCCILAGDFRPMLPGTPRLISMFSNVIRSVVLLSVASERRGTRLWMFLHSYSDQDSGTEQIRETEWHPHEFFSAKNRNRLSWLTLPLISVALVGCGARVERSASSTNSPKLVQASGAYQLQGRIENTVIVGRSMPSVISESPSGKTQNRSSFIP